MRILDTHFKSRFILSYLKFDNAFSRSNKALEGSRHNEIVSLYLAEK